MSCVQNRCSYAAFAVVTKEMFSEVLYFHLFLVFPAPRNVAGTMGHKNPPIDVADLSSVSGLVYQHSDARPHVCPTPNQGASAQALTPLGSHSLRGQLKLRKYPNLQYTPRQARRYT